VQPDGRRADVVFADVHGVKRTLHAYAEQPFCVRGQEIVVFRKHSNRGTEDNGRGSSADMDYASRGGSYRTSSYTRDRQGQDDGAIFVSDLPPDTTYRELSEALAPFGKYERLAMRTFLAFLTSWGFLSELHHRPRFKIRVFHVFEPRSG
jgi:RNA recognition motif-containing protein